VTVSARRPKSHECVPGDASAPKMPRTTLDFRTVFEAEFGYVLGTLRRLGVCGADLEDVAHDVFLHVFRHLGDYDPGRPLRPWLFGFAYRIARDFRALGRHRETASEDLARTRDPAPLADAEALRGEQMRLALAALGALDLDERAVFVAHDLEELSAPEIAELVQIPINTVYSRLRRARIKFIAEVQKGGERRHP
jgi:RNA polymerase sigma-70 factor, ECF subfamily